MLIDAGVLTSREAEVFPPLIEIKVEDWRKR
jgi:hypothetical protein